MIIYTDGACQGNGSQHSRGGFGVVVLDNDENLLYYYNKLCENTTNNKEELKAILYAMLNYGTKDYNNIPIVYSDSNYCVQTLTNWMFGWANRGWLKSDNKTPENLELIQAFYNHWQKGYRIDLKKVKGHAGNKWNEMADDLATGAMKGLNNE